MILGEIILWIMALFVIGMMHVFVAYGHIIFIPMIFKGEIDKPGWALYSTVLLGTIVLIGLWCIALGI